MPNHSNFEPQDCVLSWLFRRQPLHTSQEGTSPLSVTLYERTNWNSTHHNGIRYVQITLIRPRFTYALLRPSSQKREKPCGSASGKEYIYAYRQVDARIRISASISRDTKRHLKDIGENVCCTHFEKKKKNAEHFHSRL